jgi:hypothetical protein
MLRMGSGWQNQANKSNRTNYIPDFTMKGDKHMKLEQMPEALQVNLKKLYDLVEKNPVYIPLPAVADFLEMDRDGLRRAIESNSVPFGIYWKKADGLNRCFKIPTAQFFLWYTQGQLAA